MNTKIKIILTYLFLIIIIGSLYLWFRGNFYRNHYTQEIIKHSNSLFKSFRSLEQSFNKSIPQSDLQRFLQATRKKNKDIAYFAVFSLKGKRLQLELKNQNYLNNNEVYNLILHEITSNHDDDFSGDNHKLGQYTYNNKNIHYYVFLKSTNKYKLALLFPYTFNTVTKIKIALELSLIAIAALILIILIYINVDKIQLSDSGRIRQRDIKKKDKKTKNSTMQQPAEIEPAATITDISNNGIDQSSPPVQVNRSTIPTDQQDTFEIRIQRVFKIICKHFNINNLALYIFDGNDALHKRYVIKDNSFIKINAENFNTFHVNSNVGKELQQSRIVILDNSKKILLPLTTGNSLLGMLAVIRNKRFTGDEIKMLKKQVIDLKRYAMDYLEAHNIIQQDYTQDKPDPAFSNDDSPKKLQNAANAATSTIEEELEKVITNGKEFILLLLHPITNPDQLSNKQYNIIQKVIQPVIAKNIQTNHNIFTYQRYLAILIPDVDEERGIEISNKLVRILSKYKMKVTKDFSLMLDPKITIAAPRSMSDKQEILESLVYDMEKLLNNEISV